MPQKIANVVAFDWNSRSDSTGISGRIGLEWVVAFDWNQWSDSTGLRNQRALDHEVKIKRLVNQLKALGVEIKHEGHQKIVSSKKQVVINETGVQLA